MRRSDNITAGPERMPNRSLLRACGMTDEEMRQPIIGVVSAYSEIIPGHINLDKIADAVKAGVRMAGGTPVLVPAIGVCDGIAMGHIGMKYSLASRELIADSVETLAQAHQLDGLVLIPNCDKIVPGMLMAAARLNIPSILVSGGPMLAGHFGGEEVSLSKTFEAVGAYKAGMMDEADVLRSRVQFLPGLRLVRGHVHRKLDELPVRGHRHGAAGQRHDPGGFGCPYSSGKARRHEDHGADREGHQAARHPHAGSIPQRADLRDGDRLLDQLGSAPAGNRKRSRRTARA